MIFRSTRVVSLTPLLLLLAAAPAVGASIRLVSASSAGGSTPGNAASKPSAVSADGRYVVFSSVATDHIAGGSDANGGNDAFLWDRSSSTLTLISHAVGAPTTAANGISLARAISADGRFVAFDSQATNLIFGGSDGNGDYDCYLWDRDTETTTLVSTAAGTATTAANGPSLVVSLSADGRYLAFSSSATNLIAGQNDTNGGPDAFVWDRQTGATTLVSGAAGSSSTTANGASTLRGLSADGRHVAFSSSATNLIPGLTDGNNADDMFYGDLDLGGLKLISHVSSSSTTTANGTSIASAESSSISGDGRFVTFASSATNLITGVNELNATYDVFLWDGDSNSVALVSHHPFSTSLTGNAESAAWAVSEDGNFVVFESLATNLQIGSDTNSAYDVFLFDRLSGTVRLVSHASSSEVTAGNAESHARSVSANGRFVSFASFATDLIGGGVDSNLLDDAYHWDGVSGTVALVSHSLASPSTAASGSSLPVTMSSDGLNVALASTATDLAPGTYDGETQTFLWSLSLFEDGFESGDTSEWSATVP